MRRLIILWIVAFMILVVLHEFGHFIAARKCGFKVTEFWIWMPPKICNLRKDSKWTQYTLNWIPLWWFCSFEWDDPADPKSYENPNTLYTAKLWKRLIVVFAWVTMNFLVAFIIFTALFWHWVQPLSVSNVAEEKWSTSYLMASPSFLREKWFLTWEVLDWILVSDVQQGGLWEKIDLRADDVLLEFDGQKLDASNFSALMLSGGNSSHTFTVQRWEIQLVTEEFHCEDSCKFNILVWENWNIELKDIKFWFWWAVVAAFHEIWAEWNLTMNALWMIWKSLVSFRKSEMKEALNSLAWPIWAVKIWWLLYEMWWWLSYLWFAAMISLALAIFNVLPIPALDWWRAVWMILQKITRIKPEKFFLKEAYVDTVFIYALLVLGIIIAIKDFYVYYRDSLVENIVTLIQNFMTFFG